MKKIFTILLCISISACSSTKGARTINDISGPEEAQLAEVLNEWNACLNYEIKRLDDGRGDVRMFADLIKTRCEKFEKIIKSTLQKDFDLDVGDRYLYMDDLKRKIGTGVNEALILERKKAEQYRRAMQQQMQRGVPNIPQQMQRQPQQYRAPSAPQQQQYIPLQ